MISTTLEKVPPSTFETLATRSFENIVKIGQQFEALKSQSSPEEWEKVRRKCNARFVDASMAINALYPKLELQQRDRLLRLRFHYFPAKVGARFLKLSSDLFEKCLEDLEAIQRDIGFVSEEDLKEVILKHRPTVMSKISLGQLINEIPLDQATLSKKLGLNSDEFEQLLDELNEDLLTTTHLIEACYERELTPLEQLRKVISASDYNHWVIEKVQHLRQEQKGLNQQVQEKDEIIEQLQQQLAEAIANSSATPSQQQTTFNDINATSDTRESAKGDRPADTSSGDRTTTPGIKTDGVDNTASMQGDDESATQYIKGAKVNICEDGIIVNTGEMIGKQGEQIRVRLDTGGGSKLFEPNNLMLRDPNPQPKKKKPGGKPSKLKKGFG